MALKAFCIAINVSLLAFILHTKIHQVNAFHPMNVRQLYDFGFDGRFKKDDASIPLPPDKDVLELEKLKENKPFNSPEIPLDNLKLNNHDSNRDGGGSISSDGILPALEKQLETATIASIVTTLIPLPARDDTITVAIKTTTTQKTQPNQGQPEKEEHVAVQHRPPSLTNIHTSAISHEQQQQQQQQDTSKPITDGMEKSPPLKPFHGAARLAFGQNPEILTSTITTTATNLLKPTMNLGSDDTVPFGDNENVPVTSVGSNPSSNNNKESDSSVSAELEATKNGERRSVNIIPSKVAKNFLKHKDGHYSSFDTAQYVFWTGDEAGVAKAVEELIQQGLMSRENAIKFLRDIRLGIEYLQNSYNNRIYPDYMKGSNYMFPSVDATATTTTTTTTEAPTTRTTMKTNIIRKPTIESENIILTENLQINNARKKENSIDYDEATNRMKITDFLYAEYSLEEVIYQLAKEMFSQSLTHGSEQSQRALQRLTEFLEAEGESGKISPVLQKKVLDVLLASLSDTLTEHPELLEAARAGLGNSFHKLPKSSVNQ